MQQGVGWSLREQGGSRPFRGCHDRFVSAEGSAAPSHSPAILAFFDGRVPAGCVGLPPVAFGATPSELPVRSPARSPHGALDFSVVGARGSPASPFTPSQVKGKKFRK